MNESKEAQENMLKFVSYGILSSVEIAEASSVWTLLSSLHF